MQISLRKAWLAGFATLAFMYPLTSPGIVMAADEDDLGSKLNIYVECYNKLDGDAHKSIERYASWVKNMKVGPTGKEQVVYGLYEIDSGDIAECTKQFGEAQALKPQLGLDAVGAEYIKALGDLAQVAGEMYPYYDREDYKDDKFAKAKQLHPKFAAQVDIFQAASQKFSDELETENDKRLEAEMAQLEKEQGRKLPYLNMATMHRAKLLLRVLDKEDGAADEIAKRLAAFEAAADEELQFAKKNSQGLPIMWSMLSNNIEDFRKAAKDRMRHIRDKTPYSTGDQMLFNSGSGWMVSGSFEKVVRVYNDMINHSNDMN